LYAPPEELDKGRQAVSAEPESHELAELLDKQRIHEVLVRYCRGVDRVDRDLIASAFHPDAQCEFAPLMLSGETIGDAIADAASGCELTTHMVGNELIELHGDTAHGETYYLSSAVVGSEDGKQLRMRAGRYVDLFERRQGEWRISNRVVVEDWCRFSDLPELPPGTSFRPGQQGLGDPLYALLGAATA
jgi:hypothetical protein